MEDQCSPLSWPYNCFLEEGIEELKHSLVYTTLELENTVISAHEELARKDEEILHLKDLLTRVVKERDEAQGKCQRLGMEKILLQQQQQQLQFQYQYQFQKQHQNQLLVETAPISSGTTLSHDQDHDQILKGVVDSNHNNNIGLSNSSDSCDENNVVVSPPTLVQDDLIEKLVLKKPLPEKGKFLQAVMEAGPLLQTLLLAGPLPQWQHPPPQLNSIDIPPVTISSPTPRLLHQDSPLSCTGAAAGAGACFGKKRVAAEGTDITSPQSISKYQKVVHQSSLTSM